MPFARPTLTELRAQSIEDITTSGVPGLTGLLRNAVLRVLAWAMAGLAYSVYGYADWIARMGVPFTAEDEFLYAWAALIGVYPKAASSASGSATFTGAADSVLPLGTPLRRPNGTTYETTTEASINTLGNVTVDVLALDVGADTNAAVGEAISITTSIAGVNAQGLVATALTGGADAETNEQLRARMLAKYRAPPQGGAVADYIEWATEVPGCTRAWCASEGAGGVIVWVMFDGNGNDGFPIGTDGVSQYETRQSLGTASGDQGLVADHIYPVQPVTAMVYVAGPIEHPIDVTLANLTPDTAAIRSAISAAITDMLLITGAPGGTIYPSQLYDAIDAVAELDYWTMTVPAAPIEMSASALPTMGTLTVI